MPAGFELQLGPPPEDISEPITPPAAPPSLTPLTDQALAQTVGVQNVVDQPNPTGTDFVSRNQQTGIPLDIESGMPKIDYTLGAFERDRQKRLNYFNKQGYNARFSDTGEIIVRVQDSDTGKPKDVLANPKGLDVRDFLDLATQAPEIAAEVLMAAKGRGAVGVFPKLMNLLKMAGTGQAVGTAKDIVTREAQGNPIDPKEIFTSRAIQGASEVGIGGVAGVAAKGLTKIASPFSQKGPLQFNLEKAREHFSQKGFELHSTPGELTGNPFLLRMETFARQNPGSSIPFDKIATETAEELQKIQNVMMGLPETATAADLAAQPTAEAVGAKAVGSVSAKNLVLEGDVANARTSLAKTGTKEIEDMFTAKAGVRPSSRSEVGSNIRQQITSDFGKFKSEADKLYQAVESNPLVQEKNIAADKLSQDAQKLYDTLPKKQVTITSDSGLMDQFNKPILKTSTGENVMWEFVPDGLKTKLESLRGLQGQQFRLDELLAMRREIRNSIKQAEAIPGVQTHYLGEMEKMVDSRIRQGLDELGDPALKKAWETANDFYSKGMEKFKKYGISNVLKEPEQPGFIGDRALAEKAISDPDWLANYKQYFGATSPQFSQIKRTIMDDLATMDPLTGLIDGGRLFSNLETLANKNPEVAKELFGSSWPLAVQRAKALSYASKGSTLAIDNEELAKLASSGTMTAQKLIDLISAETKRAQVYQNGIRAAVKSGSLNADSIKPSEFVRYMATRAEPKELNEVMGILADRPDLLEDMRRVTVEEILNRASSSPRALEVLSTKGQVSKQLNASALEEVLGSGDRVQQARYSAILGRETMDDLRYLVDYLRPRELKQSAFQTAGALSAGQKISALEKGGVFHFADTALKNFIFSAIYTSRPLKAWISNNAISSRDAAVIGNYIIASTPFVDALQRQFGSAAIDKAKEIKAGLDAFVRQQNQPGNAAQPVSFEALMGPPP